MASDGLFLKAVARAHPRFGTPANTIAIQGSIQGSIASPLVLIGRLEQIISYAWFIDGGGSVRPSTAAASRRICSLDSRIPLYQRSHFLISVVLVLALVAAHTPRGTLLGVAVALAGLPLDEVFRRGRAPVPGEGHKGSTRAVEALTLPTATVRDRPALPRCDSAD